MSQKPASDPPLVSVEPVPPGPEAAARAISLQVGPATVTPPTDPSPDPPLDGPPGSDLSPDPPLPAPPLDDEPDAAMRASPGLTLVATPIGHLGDLSDRARTVLGSADLVLCEDSRVTARLLARHGVRARLQVLHDHTEAESVPRLLGLLRQGSRIALVSDAGHPVVSDPGFRLVRAAIEAGIAVTAVPGPNAAVTALALSGLPPTPFLFLGFLPPKEAARRAALARHAAIEAQGLSATLVLYEAPHRVAETLADLAAALGPDRQAVLARELTKRFEELRRGSLSALEAGCRDDPPRGEITLVVGPPPEAVADDSAIDAALREALRNGSVRDAAGLVAARFGIARRVAYLRALRFSEPDAD